MQLTPSQLVMLVIAAGAYLGALYLVDQSIPRRWRAYFRYAAVLGTIAGFFELISRYIPDHARCVDVSKGAIAATAAACVFYEAYRIGARRPVAERWKKFVGVSLGIAGIVAYFNGFRFGYAKYYHRWDQYHYYMGAKYFREMGYDGLYKCAVVAQDELGNVSYVDEDTGRLSHIDMSKEVRHADKKIRNLGGDNLLMPASSILEHPEICKAHFSAERWEAYKNDVKFFRTASDKTYWEDMQKDHGYNPPPVWTIMGKAFAELHPASTRYLQLLAGLDLVYLLGTFVALWWAFGWRVFAVAGVFWGCQASAPFYWTGGAFLRQDWLFFLTLSIALIRKQRFKLGGASLVYSGMLRIFPGLVVVGPLVVAGASLVRKRRLEHSHRQMLLGGVLAFAVLLPASLKVAGTDSYQQFYKHTLQVHDQTPLTNHMGLRVLIAHKMFDVKAGPPFVEIAHGQSSGRMKFTRDMKLVDPFEVWKRMRNERYAKYRWLAYAILAATFALFVAVVSRIRSLWIATCIAQVWVILLSQLTCYYYSFLILSAPLTRVRKQLEVPLFGLAVLTQFVWNPLEYNDDKYTALTLVSLIFCYLVLWTFGRRDSLRAWLQRPTSTEPKPA